MNPTLKALAIPVAAGSALLLALRARNVNPIVTNRSRNEGHVRMDSGRYNHLYQLPDPNLLRSGPNHG